MPFSVLLNVEPHVVLARDDTHRPALKDSELMKILQYKL